MTLTLAGTLAVLALIDSTSFGALVIPLWLMLAPGRLRVLRILVFLLTVCVFYFGVGLTIYFGAELAVEQFGDLFTTRPVQIGLFAAGLGLVAWSFSLEAKAKREKASGAAPSGRFLRWRSQAVGNDDGGAATGGTLALVGLALAAATVEVATMLPYLGAIGLITTSDIGWPSASWVLAGYCLLMVLPAVILLVLRLGAARLVDPVLRKLDAWLALNSTNTLSWLVGILGVLLVVNTSGAVL